MGTWGSGIFDDDLALDVRAGFESSVKNGLSPVEAAKALLKSDLAIEILGEFAEDERDEMFWEESGGLFFAVASIQLEHDALTPDAKRQTLQAISAWEALGAGDVERLQLLAELRARLEAASTD